MAEGTRVNKHGVPVYSFTTPRPNCLWPTCASVVETFPTLHLCDKHARRVHAHIEEIEQAERREAELAAEAAREAQRRAWEDRFPKRTVLPAPQPAADPVIYYVKNGGHIKIGWTGDLTKRMRSYPPGCELLAVHPGSRADEQKIHRKFAVHRSHGREWYPLVPVILDHVRRVVEEHGQPEAVDFGARPVTVPTPRKRQPVTPRYWTGGRRAG